MTVLSDLFSSGATSLVDTFPRPTTKRKLIDIFPAQRDITLKEIFPFYSNNNSCGSAFLNPTSIETATAIPDPVPAITFDGVTTTYDTEQPPTTVIATTNPTTLIFTNSTVPLASWDNSIMYATVLG